MRASRRAGLRRRKAKVSACTKQILCIAYECQREAGRICLGGRSQTKDHWNTVQKLLLSYEMIQNYCRKFNTRKRGNAKLLCTYISSVKLFIIQNCKKRETEAMQSYCVFSYISFYVIYGQFFNTHPTVQD